MNIVKVHGAAYRHETLNVYFLVLLDPLTMSVGSSFSPFIVMLREVSICFAHNDVCIESELAGRLQINVKSFCSCLQRIVKVYSILFLFPLFFIFLWYIYLILELPFHYGWFSITMFKNYFWSTSNFKTIVQCYDYSLTVNICKASAMTYGMLQEGQKSMGFFK